MTSSKLNRHKNLKIEGEKFRWIVEICHRKKFFESEIVAALSKLYNKAKRRVVMANTLQLNSNAYDKLAKRLLVHRPILARILKHCVTEFADCDIADIEKKYIEGDPSLSIDTVPLDDTLDISGKNTESGSPNEGLVTFDIIFDALVPKGDGKVKVIINLEPQKSTKHLHYKLMKRAVYYAARLISSQKEKEFHNDDYNNIYSIWICMDVQNYRADSIQEYKLTEDVLHGKFKDNVENYDLFRIVILNLGKEQTTHELLNLLYLLFIDLQSSIEKEKKLKKDFGVSISRDMRKELDKMGGVMQPAVDLAVEKIVGEKIKKAVGEAVEKNTKEVTEKVDKNSKLEAIRNLMETTNWTIEKVMDALKIPPALQIELKPLL